MNLRTGWNLGNTLDAHNADSFENQPANTEISWGQPETTKEMIDGLAASGLKTIRIPISWTPHINSEYEIDSKWMNRIKQIVDWCLESGMNAIINTHHDNYINQNIVFAFQGYYPNNFAREKSKKYIGEVWKQISEAFMNYDDRVIFEPLNEPRLRGHEHEWVYSHDCPHCREAMDVINELNQLAVDTIRASGGNNRTRTILVPSYVASPQAAFTEEFRMPKDIEGNQGKIALSVHMYTPYNFAMNCGDGSYDSFNDKTRKELDEHFEILERLFVKKGYPVIIGEYGATNKGNKEERIKWFIYYLKNSYKRGIVCMLWDNGIEYNKENPAEGFGFYDRKNCKWFDEDIRKAIMETIN